MFSITPDISPTSPINDTNVSTTRPTRPRTPFTENLHRARQSPAQLKPIQPHKNPAPAGFISNLFRGACNLFTSIFGNTNPPQSNMAAASPHNPDFKEYMDIKVKQALELRNRRQPTTPPSRPTQRDSMAPVLRQKLDPPKEQNAVPKPTTPPYKSTRFEFDPNENMMSWERKRCDEHNRIACSKKPSAPPQITTDRDTQSTQQSPKMNWEHELLDHINREACSGEPSPSAPYESIAPYVPLEPTAPYESIAPYVPLEPTAPYESIAPYAAPEKTLKPFEFLSLSTLQLLYGAGITKEEINQLISESRQAASNETLEPIEPVSFSTRNRFYLAGITKEEINQIINESRQRESNSLYESEVEITETSKPTAPELTDFLSLQTQEYLANAGLNKEEIGEAVIAAHRRKS